jgi:hypothetical protein
MRLGNAGFSGQTPLADFTGANLLRGKLDNLAAKFRNVEPGNVFLRTGYISSRNRWVL